MALPPDEMANVDPKVFDNAGVLTNSEVALMLDLFINQRRSQNPNYQPPPLVQKTLEYVDKFNCGKNGESMKSLRDYLESTGFKKHEITLVANLLPETAEEAFTLIPTLKDEHLTSYEEPKRFQAAELDAHLQDVLRYKDTA